MRKKLIKINDLIQNINNNLNNVEKLKKYCKDL